MFLNICWVCPVSLLAFLKLNNWSNWRLNLWYFMFAFCLQLLKTLTKLISNKFNIIKWRWETGPTTDVVPSPTSWSCRSANSTSTLAAGCSTSSSLSIVAPSLVIVMSCTNNSKIEYIFIKSVSCWLMFILINKTTLTTYSEWNCQPNKNDLFLNVQNNKKMYLKSWLSILT